MSVCVLPLIEKRALERVQNIIFDYADFDFQRGLHETVRNISLRSTLGSDSEVSDSEVPHIILVVVL